MHTFKLRIAYNPNKFYQGNLPNNLINYLSNSMDSNWKVINCRYQDFLPRLLVFSPEGYKNLVYFAIKTINHEYLEIRSINPFPWFKSNPRHVYFAMSFLIDLLHKKFREEFDYINVLNHFSQFLFSPSSDSYEFLLDILPGDNPRMDFEEFPAFLFRCQRALKNSSLIDFALAKDWQIISSIPHFNKKFKITSYKICNWAHITFKRLSHKKTRSDFFFILIFAHWLQSKLHNICNGIIIRNF